MMRTIHLFVMLLLLVSCDKGKQNEKEKAEIPYWGDSVEMSISTSIGEKVLYFDFSNLRADSICLYYKFQDPDSAKSQWNVWCPEMKEYDNESGNGSYSKEGIDLLGQRRILTDYYAIAWINGEPYRSKDQWTYGGYTYHINGDTLYQYDSTRPLVFPDSMECNQALALFFNPPQTTYWNEDVQCLGIADLNCLDKDPRLYKQEENCVIKFNGDLNDAATYLERAAPGNFITLYPWCVGLKDCGGEEPAQ